ncbi:MAG: hypothetical protein ACFHHU_10785 [Porticoccaceae bacterium]
MPFPLIRNRLPYWGDIGPDARIDNLGHCGPIGYDEINQAREAGHYGWPFFVGNNVTLTVICRLCNWHLWLIVLPGKPDQ